MTVSLDKRQGSSHLHASVCTAERLGSLTSIDTSPGGKLGTDTCSTLLVRSGAKVPPLPTPPPFPCKATPYQWPAFVGLVHLMLHHVFSVMDDIDDSRALLWTLRRFVQEPSPHQEREAIEAGCAHSEIQVVDEGGLGRHSGWVVVPDKRHCQGAPERLQAVLMRLAGGQVGQVHNLQVPAWPRALHQPTRHHADQGCAFARQVTCRDAAEELLTI